MPTACIESHSSAVVDPIPNDRKEKCEGNICNSCALPVTTPL